MSRTKNLRSDALDPSDEAPPADDRDDWDDSDTIELDYYNSTWNEEDPEIDHRPVEIEDVDGAPYPQGSK